MIPRMMFSSIVSKVNKSNFILIYDLSNVIFYFNKKEQLYSIKKYYAFFAALYCTYSVAEQRCAPPL